MKNKIIAAAIAVAGFTANSYGQSSTATASSNAYIVTPISISKEVDLDFGKISPGATGGTVALPAVSGTPTRTPSGDVLLPVITGTVTAAQFDVSGEADFTYSITLPSNGTVIMVHNVTDQIPVNYFNSSIGGSGLLDGTGQQSFYVGATAVISAAQPSGAYTADFDVTVAYL